MRLILLVILTCGYFTSKAWAHGGGTPQLTNAEVGPYWVSVWTQPEPPRVGQFHVTAAVAEPSPTGAAEPGPAVLEATVRLEFKPLDQAGETVVVWATHEAAANKFFYETDLDLPTTGRWQVTVSVAGPAGSGDNHFEIQVLPASPINWGLLGGLGLAVLAAFLVIQKLRDRNPMSGN